MKPNELAAAVERLRQVEYEDGLPTNKSLKNTYAAASEFAPHAIRLACLARMRADERTLANAYLAREADDAKPVDREWLVSVLGEPNKGTATNPEWHISEFLSLHFCPGSKDAVGLSTLCGRELDATLNNRGDVYAFLRLARWPTNENGGE